MFIGIVLSAVVVACALAAVGYALASRAERARVHQRFIAEFVAAKRRATASACASGNVVFLDAYRRTRAHPHNPGRSQPA